MIPINVTDGFYIPAKNSRGKDHNIGFRCWSELAREVARVVSEQAFNYRTAADLLRHALWRHLLWLKEQSPEMGKRMNLMELCVETAERSQRRRELLTGITYLDREISTLKQAGVIEGAKNLAFKAVNIVADSGLDSTCKAEALKLISSKHADLLRMGATPNGHE